MLIMMKQTNPCRTCKNTGIKQNEMALLLDASTRCACPKGEEKRQRVSELVARSMKKGVEIVSLSSLGRACGA